MRRKIFFPKLMDLLIIIISSYNDITSIQSLFFIFLGATTGKCAGIMYSRLECSFPRSSAGLFSIFKSQLKSDLLRTCLMMGSKVV